MGSFDLKKEESSKEISKSKAKLSNEGVEKPK